MESLHYLLMKSHSLLQRRIMVRASQLGLTSGQPKVLDYLSRYGESDQKTIASYCEIEQATMGSILYRMEKAGLVVRRQHEGNRRSVYVSLSRKGEQAAAAMSEAFAQAENEAVADLTPEEVETLKKTLVKLSDTLEAASK